MIFPLGGRARPRARKRDRRDQSVRRTCCTLADEGHDVILVACGKCDWRAAFAREELIASYGLDRPMPELLRNLASPRCERRDSMWDRCGVRYVEPIDDYPYP
jgi:hypothetical protein